MFNGNKIFKINKSGKKKEVLFIPGLKVIFTSKNSSVYVHEPFPKFIRSKIRLGEDCIFEIESSEYVIKKLNICADSKRAKCRIGKNFRATNYCEIHLAPEPDKEVLIGDNCMFGRNILIRTTDGHRILDQNTGKTLNYGKNIKIGNNVWLAEEVTILKGVEIADNCVIGLKSIVTKPCTQESSIYAGVPARLIKSKIDWRQECPE